MYCPNVGSADGFVPGFDFTVAIMSALMAEMPPLFYFGIIPYVRLLTNYFGSLTKISPFAYLFLWVQAFEFGIIWY